MQRLCILALVVAAAGALVGAPEPAFAGSLDDFRDSIDRENTPRRARPSRPSRPSNNNVDDEDPLKMHREVLLTNTMAIVLKRTSF